MNFSALDPLGSLSRWLVDGAVDAWKQAAGLALSMGNVTDTQWTTVFDVVNRIAGVMGVVAVAIGAIAIVQEAFKGSLGGVVSAVFRTLLAWPITVVLITITIRALAVESSVTTRILSWAFGGTPNIQTGLNSGALTSINLAVAAIIALLIVIGSIVLILVMTARSFLIMLGVCLAPIVTMSSAWGMLRPALHKWGSWMTGVILFKPLAAIILFITSKIIDASSGDITSYYAAIVGIILSSVFPWTLIKIVSSFLPGSDGLHVMSSAGQSTVGAAAGAVRTATALGVGALTGGATLAGGASSLLGSSKSAATASETASLTDTAQSTGKDSPSKSSDTSSTKDSSTSSSSSSSSTTPSSSRGLSTGVGSFMSQTAGILSNAASSGIAPSGASSAMSAGAKIASTLATTASGSDAQSYTSGQAAPATVNVTTNSTEGSASSSGASQTTIVATPVSGDTTPIAVQNTGGSSGATDQKVDVNVHVDSAGSGSIHIDKN